MACFQAIFLVALLRPKDFGHRIKQRSTLLNSKFSNSKLSDQNYLTRNINKRRKFCVWQNIGHRLQPSPSFRVLSQCRYRVIINKRTGSNFGHFSHRPFLFMFLSCNRHVRSLSSLGSLRWLDWIFLGGYLPSLSVNHVSMSKDIEKRLPQLYYIKMKISYDLGFTAIGVAMAT